MPVAAVDSQEYIQAAERILKTILDDRPLSSFDRKRFEILSEKLVLPEERMQLRALLYLVDGNEDAFYKMFDQAILASDVAALTRQNYVAALAILGDWENAAAQLREILKNPIDVFRTGILEKCIELSYAIMEPDLAETFLQLAEKNNYKITHSPAALQGIISSLPDNDPLLLATLDTMMPEDAVISEERIERSEKLLERCRKLVEGVEADYA